MLVFNYHNMPKKPADGAVRDSDLFSQFVCRFGQIVFMNI